MEFATWRPPFFSIIRHIWTEIEFKDFLHKLSLQYMQSIPGAFCTEYLEMDAQALFG